MKTKAPKDGRRQTEIFPDAVPTPSPEVVEDVSRLSFAVDGDGRIIWDGMREKTRARLKAILGSPETAKALGVESAVPVVEVFDPAWTGALYDSVGKLESFLAAKIYHIPSDIADQAFTYSAAEKQTLAGPTAKVINKYAATWMIMFKDEIALAFLFVTLTAVKLQMATGLQAARKNSGPRPIRHREEASATDPFADVLENSVQSRIPDA